jgi:Fic family protein
MKKKEEKKVEGPLYSNDQLVKALADFITVRQLADKLKVTLPTARTYLNKLGKLRKIETKSIRQGARGPLSVAFRIRVR